MATSSPWRRRISASYSFFFILGRAALAASNSSMPDGGRVGLRRASDVVDFSSFLAFLSFFLDFLLIGRHSLRESAHYLRCSCRSWVRVSRSARTSR